MSNPMIAVWFSCGAASAVAAKLTLQRFGGTHHVRVLNNPIAEEDADNRRFLRDCEEWLGVDIEEVKNSKYPTASAVDVWDHQKAMVFPDGAPCTLHLKKKARQQWEVENKAEHMVLGFTSEEKKRHDRFALTERDNVLPVLIDANLTKQDCYNTLRRAGVEPPSIYKRGYPNANCIGCVKATSPTYWNHVRRQDPQVFSQRAEQSRRLGVRLARVKDERMFLDELHPDAKGRPMKEIDFECGLFCEETS